MTTFAPAMKNRLLAFLWITCLFVAVATAANKKFTLVIDAGHGGTDAGAVDYERKTYQSECSTDLWTTGRA